MRLRPSAHGRARVRLGSQRHGLLDNAVHRLPEHSGGGNRGGKYRRFVQAARGGRPGRGERNPVRDAAFLPALRGRVHRARLCPEPRLSASGRLAGGQDHQRAHGARAGNNGGGGILFDRQVPSPAHGGQENIRHIAGAGCGGRAEHLRGGGAHKNRAGDSDREAGIRPCVSEPLPLAFGIRAGALRLGGLQARAEQGGGEPEQECPGASGRRACRVQLPRRADNGLLLAQGRVGLHDVRDGVLRREPDAGGVLERHAALLRGDARERCGGTCRAAFRAV